MNRQALENWARQELAREVVKGVLGELERNGVRPIPVKGIVLARDVYDSADRFISDVDMLITPKELPRAIRTARNAGCRLVWDSKSLGNVNFVVKGVPMDVATSVGPAGFSATKVTDLLRRASRSEHPLGFAHWRIEQHDHALLLAIDAFKDKLGRGKAWAGEDLVRIADMPGFSAATLIERAHEARLATMLTIVADWVVATARSNVWQTLVELLRSRPVRREYVTRYARLLSIQHPSRWQQRYLSAITRTASDSAPRRALALGMGALGTLAFVARHGSVDADVWGQP